MPLQRCADGRGWQFGNSGKCYTGADAYEQAARQGRAIKASQARRAAFGYGLMAGFGGPIPMSLVYRQTPQPAFGREATYRASRRRECPPWSFAADGTREVFNCPIHDAVHDPEQYAPAPIDGFGYAQPPAPADADVDLSHPLTSLYGACKHASLLEDHLVHPEKQCGDCIRKHLLTMEAFVEEAVALDEDGQYDTVLANAMPATRKLVETWKRGIDPRLLAQQVRALRRHWSEVCFSE